jgi:hypothetical protein
MKKKNLFKILLKIFLKQIEILFFDVFEIVERILIIKIYVVHDAKK